MDTAGQCQIVSLHRDFRGFTVEYDNVALAFLFVSFDNTSLAIQLFLVPQARNIDHRSRKRTGVFRQIRTFDRSIFLDHVGKISKAVS